MIIDPFGVGLSNRASNMDGIRISPKQSPVYQLMVRSIHFLIEINFFVLVDLWSNIGRLSFSRYSHYMVAIRILNICIFQFLNIRHRFFFSVVVFN